MISKNSPTDTEHAFLLIVYQYMCKHNHESPSNRWVQDQLKYSTPSGVANVKKSLRDKGFLYPGHGKIKLTDKGLLYCQDASISVLPTQIPLLGKVSAGKTTVEYEWNEALVANWQSGLQENDYIMLPPEGKNDVFFLQVVGESMVHEGIFPNDYILVQRFKDDQKPRQLDMIVTNYLPLEYEQEELGDIEAYLVWPVVKYYIAQEKEIVLGWRNHREEAPDKFCIRTRFIRSIGKVVGVYRNLG